MKKAFVLLVVTLAAVVAAPARGEEEDRNFLEAAIAGVTLGKGFQAKQITVKLDRPFQITNGDAGMMNAFEHMLPRLDWSSHRRWTSPIP